jgi:hypothetical protein
VQPAPIQQPATTQVFRPIVETVGYSLNNNQVTLSGRSIQSGVTGSTSNLLVGFLISSSANLDPKNPSTLKVPGNARPNLAFSATYSLGSGTALYFKAFAENEAGSTYGRTLKISKQKENSQELISPEEKALNMIKNDAVPIAAGWLQSSWFGSFKEFDGGWIFHADHGWLYLSSDSQNGIWAWSRDRGWVWSKKPIYPFLFQNNTGNWLYFLKKINGVLYYYNYSSRSLEIIRL